MSRYSAKEYFSNMLDKKAQESGFLEAFLDVFPGTPLHNGIHIHDILGMTCECGAGYEINVGSSDIFTDIVKVLHERAAFWFIGSARPEVLSAFFRLSGRVIKSSIHFQVRFDISADFEFHQEMLDVIRRVHERGVRDLDGRRLVLSVKDI